MTDSLLISLLATMCLSGSASAIAEDPGLEPLPLVIRSVVPHFRADSLGPEFVVTYVNKGATPIRADTLANAVLVEAGGVRYGRGAMICNCIPAELAPGTEGQEHVLVGAFGIPLAPGTHTITILIGGVRSPPVLFAWQPRTETH